MLSTLMNYRLYSADMAKSLTRVSTQAAVQRDTEYYKANIGKVKTADDLLKDQRLYAFAMKAYGLEDQIQSKGLMKKVLTSDLSDANSFANKLTDKRYRDFASSFQFGSAGKAAIQTAAQTEALTEAYSQHRVAIAGTAAKALADYGPKLQAIVDKAALDGTVDVAGALLDDRAIFTMMAKVADLDPSTATKNQLWTALTNGTTSGYPGLVALRSMFNFDANGSVTSGKPVQDAAQFAAFSGAYYDGVGAGATLKAASVKTTYFHQAIAGVDKASKITNDDQLLSYVLNAFGLDPSVESSGFVLNVLTDDGGPSGALATMPASTSAEIQRKSQFTALKAAFDFDQNGDPRSPGTIFGSGFSASKLEERFYTNYQSATTKTDNIRTANFEARLSNMKSINDLISVAVDPLGGSLNYVLTAFGIDPATESISKIRKVLLSDPSDPNSYVRKLKDERYERLAAAFNFGPDGKAATPRLAQSISAQTATGSLYAATFADASAQQKQVIKADTEAYLTSVGQIQTLDDFIADKKVIKFALRAYGLGDEAISDRDMRRLLTSDLGDPQSFANAKGDKRYVKLVQAFNFTTDGRIQREGDGAQSGAKLLTTQNQYLLQTMEKQVGEQSEGARLALYFLRKAPDVTSAYGILADKALFEVVRTALSLPASIAGMDIEKQAKLLESKIDIKDFQDVKKLDKFISRFSSLYDTANGGGTTSPILALFGNSAGANGILGYL